VSSDRELRLQEALRAGAAQAAEARRKKKERLVRQRPWQALEEEWHEQMRRVFGKGYVSSAWKVHEPKLARALLKEVTFEVAVDMLKRFISTWDKPGTPSFGYFWKARDSVRADMEFRTALHTDEHQPEKTRHLPKIGW
jgi:hypothetical protein